VRRVFRKSKKIGPGLRLPVNDRARYSKGVRVAGSLARTGVAVAAFLLLAAPAGAQTPGPSADASSRPPALSPSPSDALTRALRTGEIDAPRYALDRATSLFRLRTVRERYGAVERPDPRSATLILRDLSLRLDELSPAARKRALELLARPTDPPNPDFPEEPSYSVAEAAPICTADFCIHYVTSTVDAVPSTDVSPADGIPDWVVEAAAVVQNVWTQEVDVFGYRPPLSDDTSPNDGGDGRFDVYLGNVGDDELYGYCMTDDPKSPDFADETYDLSAYCVIDNDFLEPIFTANSPLENMQVTVAHEFFHAVQAAYDWLEDTWMIEGTASWIEDEVYDAVNDSRQYLGTSPLSHSGVPLDWGAGGFEYGSWIYFRRLSERFGTDVVRSIWNRADGSAAGPDDYSVQAIARTLSGRGTTFRLAFNEFSRANRRAHVVYEEGSAYPQPSAFSTWILRRRAPGRSQAFNLFQLGAQTISFKPGLGIGRHARLRISLELPPVSRGAEVGLLRYRSSGALMESRRIALPNNGDKTFKVGFGRGTVKRVELVLMNASTRYACWQGVPGATCQGFPVDDLRNYRYNARASG
jgi:hypothetical protein